MKTELQNDIKGFGGQKCNKNKALHASYIDVNSIKNSNTEFFLTTAISPTANPSSANFYDNKVNLAELNLIHKISERKDLFPLLIKSVCPSIYGHELVKTGLVLCLFGGTDYRLKNKGDFADFLMCRDDPKTPGVGADDNEMDDENKT
jgi:DNA replicative helicase MCM subunit Mcm2 (Cdc46/Mcm family)